MASQLLVASGVAAVCGLLGVSEWLRTRALRSRARQAGHIDSIMLPVQRRATYDRITPLDAMTGHRLRRSTDPR